MNPAPLLPLLLLLGLGSVLADPAQVKWCLKSDLEFQKCRDLSAKVSEFSCVKKPDTKECIKAIKSGEADAITLDSGDIYFAGLNNYDLQPIIAENYGDSSEGCYYAVAVVKKSSNFKIRDLRGKKSCHTGLKKSAGWNIPVGTLLSLDILQWGGNEDETVEDVVSEFFSQSCAPGAVRGSKLCALCKKDCSRSQKEPYYDYNGAFQCLADDAGDVAFVKHLTVPDSEKANYELLCKDNTRAPIDNYKTCHLAKVPAHAVVTRKDPQLADRIWTSLNAAKAKGFDLFSSEAYSTKNLMFKDSTVKLVKLPAKVNSLLYLGSEYMDILRSINKDSTQDAVSSSIKWCAVGHAESQKCKNWMFNNPAIECDVADSVEECMERIVLKSADAMAVDGGQVYTAGKCGLVPAMVEQYDEARCNTPGAPASSYYAVAVVKKGSGLTWDSLKGKRSCHTGIGRTAGWNIPMGRIYGQTGNCDFTKFFSSGCAPGANASSPFCTQCIGSGQDVGDTAKCKASAEERYYGYAGAFRCLVEGAGDVAFIKHTIVGENSDGNSPEWAAGLKSADYELICPGKAGPVPITDFGSCHLAIVPAHAVVTRQGKRNEVIRILQEQQQKFGSRGTGDGFYMFQSEGGKNLLFKDSTRCLQVVPAGQNYQTFLGPDYMQAMTSLRKCSDTASELEKACSFSCQ